MVARFVSAILALGACALLSAQPALAHRLHVAHLGARQGTVHMHTAGHAGLHPHG